MSFSEPLSSSNYPPATYDDLYPDLSQTLTTKCKVTLSQEKSMEETAGTRATQEAMKRFGRAMGDVKAAASKVELLPIAYEREPFLNKRHEHNAVRKRMQSELNEFTSLCCSDMKSGAICGAIVGGISGHEAARLKRKNAILLNKQQIAEAKLGSGMNNVIKQYEAQLTSLLGREGTIIVAAETTARVIEYAAIGATIPIALMTLESMCTNLH